MRRSTVHVVMTAVLVVGLMAVGPAGAETHGGEATSSDDAIDAALPIVYVHGGAGSAAQYRTQQMRFAANGYPNVVVGIDRPSGVPINPLLDEFIDDLLAQTGDDRVYVVGHSAGTAIMNTYLNSEDARAARVAKYIAIDGAPANCGDIVTECTNIFAAPLGQGHTEAVTSAESFVIQHEFLTGTAPATTEVVPEAAPEVSGRVVEFPANLGPGEATMRVWEVDDRTGHRTGTEPYATFTFDADADAGPDQDAGRWGPLTVDPHQHYEFELLRADAEITAHYYLQPFTRSTDLVRLLVTPPGSPILTNTDVSDDHSSLVAIRYREWWGDDPDGGNDSLMISTTGVEGPSSGAFPVDFEREQLPTEVVNAEIAPRSNSTIGVHIFDRDADGVTDTSAPHPFYFALPFQTGVDVYMPASEPVDGTIHLVNAPRGDADRLQVVNVPNWRSSEHRVVVEFNDYLEPVPTHPVVYVHGGSGSAAQYQSPAMRFASNAYPNLVTGIDRISANHDVIAPILDDFFDAVLAETGDDRVHVVGHSQGVSVMNAYLNSSPDRAARVARYIGIDSGSGVSREVCPGNVPCMGVWGEGDPARQLGPYHNVRFDDQLHTEVVTSPGSFAAQYRFFTGLDPATTEVLPEDDIEISGRAVDFPANTSPGELTIRIWPVDAASGGRTTTTPHAVIELDEASDGSWGPIAVAPGQHYEFELSRAGSPRTAHYYRPPFVRSNHLVRLLIAPDLLLDATDTGPDHSSVVVLRYKEWLGDDPGGANDSLEVATTSAGGLDQEPLEVVNAATSPGSNRTIGIHLYDRDIDGASDASAPIPFFFSLPFQTGVDVFMPASEPVDGTISLQSTPRAWPDRPQTINVANWPSEHHRIAIEFDDFPSRAAVALGANLTPEAEVPPVESDGAGYTDVLVLPDRNELCHQTAFWDLNGPVSVAHIHRGEAGTNGPIVVHLATDQRGHCTPVGADLLAEILAEPGAFYVNVHSEAHPPGEIRGQLEPVEHRTTRFDPTVCAVFERISDALGLDSVPRIVRGGVHGLRAVAESGGAVDLDGPTAAGSCAVTVPWPASEVPAVDAAADAWGLDSSQLHHTGGRLILELLWGARDT